DDMTAQFAKLPLSGLPVFADDATYYDEWLRHPSYDDFWAGLDVRQGYERLSLPALNMGGWYDIFIKGTLGNYTGMRTRAATGEARRRQHLLIGPWNHEGMRAGNPIGAIDFGRRSTGGELDVDGMHLRWYDRWLKEIDNGVEDEPPVRIFVMGSGAGHWRTAADWPLPETEYQSWYFHSDGRANTLTGDGSLSLDMAASEPPDSYVYNPRNPVPSMGGGLCCNAVYSQGGAYDQRSVEAREDVLVYSSAVLAEPLEVVGPVKVILYAASSAVDTDFTAKLVDVEPCGLARNLTDSIIRARYRNSMSEPELLTPGEVVAYEIDLIGTANLFQKGHRIRVEISSSNFPRFDRNLNTGEDQATGTEMVSALQTVLHSSECPSRIVLPVVPLSR
ncbi:MAG TPA: CocE/NonD family hydrolase, partial [Thermomicrobiaceae bacterium]|nr:CocE/NonD family hydrolase [Thermomicrobiaceae bacterium]